MVPQSPAALARALRLALALVSVALALCLVQGDDGLRHVGLAFGAPRTWGEVYPFSYFQVFASYDPWAGYDLCLRGLAAALECLPLPTALLRFFALRLLAAGFVAALLGLSVQRARLTQSIERGSTLLLALLLTAAALAQPVLRQLAIRPFAFGTLLLLYSVGQRGALRGFLASAVTLFMYPYLGWIYTGPVIVAQLWRGSRSFAAGSLLATLLALAAQPAAFWGLLVSLLRSDGVRSQLTHHAIGELTSLVQHPFTVIAALAAAVVLVPQLRRPQPLRVEHILMLLFAPVAVKYVRYFLDVELCLAFVAYGPDALALLQRASGRMLDDYRRWLRLPATPTTPAPDAPAQPPAKLADQRASGSGLVRLALVVGYAALSVFIVLGCVRQYRELGRAGTLLTGVPHGSLLLSDFNSQYEVLYNRPDLSLVPSCEIGFPRDDIKAAYLGYFNRGRVCTLAKAVSASYFLETRADYLDPQDTACLRLVHDNGPMRLWRVGP